MSFDDFRIEIQKRHGVDHIQAKNVINGWEIEPLKTEYRRIYQGNGSCGFTHFCDRLFSKESSDQDRLFRERYKFWTGLVYGAHGLHD